MAWTREKYNKVWTVVSAGGGLASIIAAVVPASWYPPGAREIVGVVILSIWALGPPVFFWVDWVKYCNGLDADKLDAVKHTHDLARNIWVALVIVLAVLFGLKWPT